MRGFQSRHIKWLLVAAAVFLSACTNPFAEDAPTFSEILSAGWLEDDDDEPLPLVPLYCYDTIGAPDCHAAPLIEEGGRLRGYEGPKPPVRVEP